MKTNNKNYIDIKACRCCKNLNLIEVLDLNNQPLANSYHNGSTFLEEYPLKLNLCPTCFHSQLSISVKPDLLFKHYLYVSGTSKTLHEYFDWFADFVSKNDKEGYVLDIACNDGTQLSKFKKRGWKTFGIDPAANLTSLSQKNADEIVCDYFTETSVTKLSVKKFNAIIAQNVFAHVDDVDSFLTICHSIMDDESKLYIQTSQADMIENNQFDTIYHEHLSFFSTKSMKTLANRLGFKLLSVVKTPIHGTSYVFVLGKKGTEDETVLKTINEEMDNGRYSLATYEQYKINVQNIIKTFTKTVDQYKKLGYLIIGYGAAAKGNTFLNAAKVKLHYVIDDNPDKHNLLLPGTNAFILDKDVVNTFANDVLFIPLAWNFYSEIKQKINKKVNELSFKSNFNYLIYSYYPNPVIETL